MQRKAQHRRAAAVREAEIARVAAAQHGVVTRRQLVALGVGPGAIAHRVRCKRLHPVHRGVYLVGCAVASNRARQLAAVLACGDGAVLSHRSAARLWGFLPYPAQPHGVDVTLPGLMRHRRPGIKLHRASELPRDEVAIRDGIPVTQPPRTLLDLAAQASRAELEHAVNEAHALRRVGRPQLETLIRRHRGKPGVRLLTDAAGLTDSHRTTRSPAERRLLELVCESDLPPPETNVQVGGHEVDFLWRNHGLVVEIDGWGAHGSRPAFERDRRRDAELAAVGLTVIRVTWRQLTREPTATLVSVREALARRAQAQTKGG